MIYDFFRFIKNLKQTKKSHNFKSLTFRNEAVEYRSFWKNNFFWSCLCPKKSPGHLIHNFHFLFLSHCSFSTYFSIAVFLHLYCYSKATFGSSIEPCGHFFFLILHDRHYFYYDYDAWGWHTFFFHLPAAGDGAPTEEKKPNNN